MAGANLRVPKLVYGDYHRRSGTFIMLFEFVHATFTTIQTPTPREKSVLVLEKLAGIHSTFWGGAYAQGSVAFIPAVNAGAQKIVGKVAAKHLKTLYTGAVAEVANEIPDDLKRAISEMYVPEVSLRVQDHFANSDWMTVCHGDPRWVCRLGSECVHVLSEVESVRLCPLPRPLTNREPFAESTTGSSTRRTKRGRARS